MDIPPPPSSVPPPPPPPPPSFSAAPPPGFPAAPPPGYGSAPAGNGIAPRPGLAVAALVLGIVGVCLCFLFVPSLLALIFGVRAARKIRRSEAAGQPMAGKGFAKAGWILGIVGIVAFAAFVVVAIVTDDNKVQLSELEVGDCVDIGGFGADARIDELPRVDCDTPHDGEVYAVDTLPSGAYPGLDEVKDEVAARCNADVTDYVDADVDLSELTYASIYPPEDGWPKHRDYFCILTSADDSKLTGPINDSGG